MRAEMTFLEDNLRAEIVLVEEATRSEMEKEIAWDIELLSME